MRGRFSTWSLWFMAFGLIVPIATRAELHLKNGEWRAHGGDSGSTKYSPLDQISKENVANLRIAWRRSAVDAQTRERYPDVQISNNFHSTPLMVGGVLYASNGVGLVEAIDPSTGHTIWAQEPLVKGAEGLKGTSSSRNVAYWSDGSSGRILAVRGEYLFALDAKTGSPHREFGDNGKVDLKVGLGPRMTQYRWSSGPVVCRDVVIVGSGMTDSPKDKEMPPGDVRAYDVRTGKLRWTFHVIPHEGEVGVETWEGESWKYTGNGNIWSVMSADEDLGYVYLPFTSPTNDWYGGERLGNNLFTDSLVCVEAKTGKRVWHFQIVHHDLWDYDLPTAPVLADITVDGKRIKAVVQVTKHGFAFVFDRVTGRPVWPIEERPVPRSSAPGEKASPTQPVPAKPPPFDRQGLTIDDLIDFTPELRAEAVAIFNQYVTGPLFTPPSVKGDGTGAKKGTIFLPGWIGGANWGGAALDPETGILYVPSVTAPLTIAIGKGNPQEGNLAFVYTTREFTAGPRGLPLVKPPYGRITAIDLNRGELLWMVPNGDGPRDHPLLKGLNLPPLGQPGRVAPLLTKTLLFVGDGHSMGLNVPPGAGGKKFRALDKATGKVLWETELPADVTGAPMTYLSNGKQYILVAVGAEKHPGEFVALALP